MFSPRPFLLHGRPSPCRLSALSALCVETERSWTRQWLCEYLTECQELNLLSARHCQVVCVCVCVGLFVSSVYVWVCVTACVVFSYVWCVCRSLCVCRFVCLRVFCVFSCVVWLCVCVWGVLLHHFEGTLEIQNNNEIVVMIVACELPVWLWVYWRTGGDQPPATAHAHAGCKQGLMGREILSSNMKQFSFHSIFPHNTHTHTHTHKIILAAGPHLQFIWCETTVYLHR